MPFIGRWKSRKLKKSESRDSGLESDESPEDTGTLAEDEPPPGDTPRDFFELEPEEVAAFKPPGPTIASRKRLNIRPVLAVLAGIVVIGLIVAGIIVIWPSSRVGAPDLVGKILSEAMETARRAGLHPQVTGWEYSEEHSDGVVLSQNPSPKKTVVKGSKILLTVSKGTRTKEESQIENTASEPTGESEGGPLTNRTICVDPGHQAPVAQEEWADPGRSKINPGERGARGVATGNPEYLVAMDIGVKLKDLLEKDGINVVMTRETNEVDVTSIIRAQIAGNNATDLLVSIHVGDSSDGSTRGTRTLYPARTKWTENIYAKSKTAALFIEEELVKSCGTIELGIESRDKMTLFNWSQVPVVQAEVAFLSNSEDDKLLAEDEFRWKVAWGIRNGIIDYLTNP